MKYILFLISVAFITGEAIGQDLFAVLYDGAEPQKINAKIDSIVSNKYHRPMTDEPGTNDTVIVIDSDSVRYALQSKMVESFPDTRRKIIRYYNSENELVHTENTTLDDSSRVISMTTTYADLAVANAMNSTKNYYYIDNKLTRINENGKDVLRIEYDELELPEKLTMDAGFIGMSFHRSKTQSGYRYDGDFVAPEDDNPLWEMLKDKIADKPLTYLLIENQTPNRTFRYIEENKETGEFESEEVYVRDGENRVIEKREMSDIGKHLKFKYNADGEIEQTTDVSNDEILVNEFDDEGRITKKYMDYNIYLYQYNDKGDLIQERMYHRGGEDQPAIITTFKTYYK